MEKGYWKSNILISQMTDKHLINASVYLLRKIQELNGLQRIDEFDSLQNQIKLDIQECHDKYAEIMKELTNRVENKPAIVVL